MKNLPKSTKILGSALVVSLATNLFLGGFFAARLLRELPPVSGAPMVFSQFRGDLPPGVQEEVRNAMRNSRVEMSGHLKRIREANRTVLELVRQEPFDREELDAALREIRQLQGEMQSQVHDYVIRIVPELKPADRTRLMRRWQRMPRGGDRSERRRRPPQEPENNR